MARTVAVRLQADVGQYVSGMNKAAAATLRLGESASGTSKKAQSGFDLAGKSSMLMGAAVVGGLGLAVSKSLQFEKSMSAVGAATQATGTTLLGLRDAAMKAGADTKYSATEAADAITEMGKAGVSAKDIMGGGLTGALSLAAAGQIDVAEAAGIASTAMTQFSLSGKDLPHVADLLAAGAGKAMGSVDDLGMALNQAGLIASAAGLTIEETTGGLAAFASAGLIGSDAGTSFKTMLQALQAPSSKAAGIMADLGINMYDANGNMLGLSEMAGQLQTHLSGLTQEQRNSALATIFGTDAVRAANVLYKEGAKGISDWTEKVNDSGYAAKQAAALQDNLSGDLEKLGGSFDTLMITLGGGAQGPLRELVQMLGGVVDGITWLVQAWQSLPGPVQVAIVTLGAVAALKGPVGDALTAITLKAMNLPGVFARAGGAMGGLKAAGSGLLGVFGGPWGLAITGATVAVSLLGSGMFDMGKKTADAAGFQRTLTSALKESNGAIDDNVRALAAQKAADTKIDGSSLLKWAQDAKVALPDVTSALLGNEDAFKRVMAGLEAYKKNVFNNSENYKDPAGIIANIGAAEDAFKALAPTMQGAVSDQQLLSAATGTTADALTMTGAAANGAATGVASVAASAEATYGSLEGYAAALGLGKDATQALIDSSTKLGQSLADFVDPLGTYTGLLQVKAQAEADAANKTAEKTGAASKSWQDFKDSVHVTFGEYMKDLEGQVAAQAAWQTNMLLLAGRVSTGTLDELSRMGPEGAPLVADLVNRSDAELAKFDDVTAKRSKEATDAWGAQLTMAAPVLAAVGKKAGKGVVDQLAKELQAGTITVAQIAAKYGVSLAGGINPVLTALGKRPIAGVGGRLGGLTERWVGGYTGDGGKYEPKGIVHGGEYVLTKDQTSRLGVDQIETFANNGYANGGFVSAASVPRPYSTAPFRMPISTAGDATMQKEFDEVRAWMTANAAPAFTGGGVSGGNAANRALGRQIAAGMGLGGQFPAIDFVFSHESGWNNLAQNPTSTAYGIAQFLDSTWATVGGHKTSDPGLQIQYGLKYMNKYGGPNGAAAFWQGHHWYKSGTSYVPETGLAGLHKGEAVLTREQAEAYRAGLRSRETSGGGRGGAVAIDYDRLARAVGARSTSIAVTASPNERALAAAIVDRQRDLEFLHG